MQYPTATKSELFIYFRHFFLSQCIKIPTSTEIFSSYLINDRYILDQFCPISSKKETYILLEKINYMKTDQIRVQIKNGVREERRGKKR